MGRRVRFAFVLTAFWVVFGSGSAAAAGGQPAWGLRFSADFTTDFDKRFAVGDDWLVRGGQWAMADGMLQGKGPGAVLLLKKRFRAPLRVEYDCRSDDPCDLSLVLRSDLSERGTTGYHIGFGAYNNTYSKIDATPGGELARSTSLLIEPGKMHHVVVTLAGGRIQLRVDGKPGLSARSPSGISVRHVGFYIYNTGAIDNLKVYSPHPAHGAVTIEKRQVRVFRGFQDAKPDSVPPECKVTAGPKCRVRIVDRPTWVYDWIHEPGKEPAFGLFYTGIDTGTRQGRSMCSWDGGRTFQPDSLRIGRPPGPATVGEYMVRLEVRFVVCPSGHSGGNASRRHYKRAEARPAWQTIRADDGKHESHWGTSSNDNQLVRKVLPLGCDPADLRAARVKYLMASDVYHPPTRRSYRKAADGVRWADVRVWVNDEVVAQGSPLKLATRGWHEIAIDPGVLKRGDNTIDLTWAPGRQGEHFVPDPCVELADANESAGQSAGATFQFPTMSAGLVQFDVLLDEGAKGEALCAAVGDGVALVVDGTGTFHWQAGKRRIRLLDRLRYPNVPGDGGPFRLRTGRWYTVRIDFDGPNHVANVALVDLYVTRDHPGKSLARFLVLGQDLPMPVDEVERVTFGTGGLARLYVDNVFAISRTQKLASEKAWRVPARRIADVHYPLRKDPFGLHAYSLRHLYRATPQQRVRAGHEYIRLRRGQHRTMVYWAMQYNRLLVDQALLCERFQDLRRAHGHLSGFAGNPAAEFDRDLASLGRDLAEVERQLDEFHRFYARCYLDRMNEAKLGAGAGRRVTRLRRLMWGAFDGVAGLLGRIRRQAAKHGPTLSPPPIQLKVDHVPCAFANGAFRRNGQPVLLAAQRGDLPFTGQQELLGLGHCLSTWAITPTTIWGAPQGQLYLPERVQFWTRRGSRGRASRGTTVGVSLGYFIGLHRCTSVAPKWWQEKHRTDPDLYLKGPDGQHADTLGERPQLNFWHPKVQGLHEQLCRETTGDYARQFSGRVWFGHMAAEGFLCAEAKEGRFETGYNTTAVTAFRGWLKKTYGTIDAMNAKWRTRHKSFDAIGPPPSAQKVPRVTPTGLTYDWARFRQQSWHAWIRRCRDAARQAVPGLPLACYLSIGMLFGPSPVSGFDPVEMCKTFDIIADHGRLYTANMVCNSRAMDALRKATGRATGNLEWGAYPFFDIFDERDVKGGSLCLAHRMLHWGDTVLEYWAGTGSGWADTCNWTDPRLGHTLLRYSTMYIPLSIARAQANASVWFGCPTVDPDVVILESQASFYNSWPTHLVRGTMRGLALQLESKGHNYGFLYEKLLLAGGQRLDGVKVVLLPHGVTLPTAMADMLLKWVRAGGVLIALGPPGLYDPYGAPDGRLLAPAFGGCRWTRGPKGGYWRAKFDRAPKYHIPDDGRYFMVEAGLGKGRVYVANWSASALCEAACGLVRTHAPRRFFARHNRVELVMRRGTDCRYLSILNATPNEVHDEIVLLEPRATVIDTGTGVPVPVTAAKGQARFPIRLAPVEGMVVRITGAPELRPR